MILIHHCYAIPNSQDDGYWVGVKVRTREEGVFPGNYVTEQHTASTPPTTVRLSTPVCFGALPACLPAPHPPYPVHARLCLGDGRGGRHEGSSRECSHVLAEYSGPRDVCVYKDCQL